MELILWRHAEADDRRPDAARRLTARGEKQARKMAEWLQQHLPAQARIVASPALRCQQTAHALAALAGGKVHTEPALAPGAAADAVLQAVHWPQARAAVVVVGHQPTLGQVAGRLLGADAGHARQWSVRKGAVWWLQSRMREGERQVVLRAVVNPDLL